MVRDKQMSTAITEPEEARKFMVSLLKNKIIEIAKDLKTCSDPFQKEQDEGILACFRMELSNYLIGGN